MSLDISQLPERELGQQPAKTLRGDPVASLSRQSGIAVETLSGMSSKDYDGLVALETVVGRALHKSGQVGSTVTPEMAQAAVVARNRVRDDLIGRDARNGLQLADARVNVSINQ